MIDDFYNKLHNERDEEASGSYAIEAMLSSKVFCRWLNQYDGKKIDILDIGCAEGTFLKQVVETLNKRGVSFGRVVGIDRVESPDNVFSDILAEFEFMQLALDGNTIPCDAALFDLVFCSHVLEHVFETEKFLREVKRVMRQSGLALIGVPNIAYWLNRVLFLFGSQPLGTELGTEATTYGFLPAVGQKRLKKFIPVGHIRGFTPRGLQDICAAQGFKIAGWWNQCQRFQGFRSLQRNMGVFVTHTKSTKED